MSLLFRRAESAGGDVRMDDTGGVLTVLQQGSPPRQRLGRSRDTLAHKVRKHLQYTKTHQLRLDNVLFSPIIRVGL